MADESGDDRPTADGEAADGDTEGTDPVAPDEGDEDSAFDEELPADNAAVDGPSEGEPAGDETPDDDTSGEGPHEEVPPAETSEPATPSDESADGDDRVDSDDGASRADAAPAAPDAAGYAAGAADDGVTGDPDDPHGEVDLRDGAQENVGDGAETDRDAASDEPFSGTDAPSAGELATDHESAESDGGYGGDPFEDHEEYEMGEPAIEGAPDDEEMPLADHIEEMVKRLGVVIVIMAVVSGVVFPFADRLINFFWYSYLPGSFARCGELIAAGRTGSNAGAACPRVYHPLALILARLKVASLVGFVIALPVFVYETYLFMRPGLYLHERRYYLASVPTSLVLATVGVAFAHFLVLPAIFTYFVYYSENATVIAFGLAETFDLMVLMMGGFAVVFQIPLFIMLALMMGLVTRRWMVERRLLFWGAFAGIAFLFSPDPTGMAPFIVAATMIGLFEGTLLLAKWTGR